MKNYKAVFNPAKNKGVFGISLVSSPAMESEFIALNKQENNVMFDINLASVNEAEYTLLGVALIPDKPIYRNQGGEEFTLTFPKETIKDVAHNFIQMGYQTNSTLEHDTNVQGVSIVEAWLVKDPKNDTANAYGLPKDDIVEGAWVVKMKCDNKEIYQDALECKIKGFSIEGLLTLEEIKLSKSINMESEILKVLKGIPEAIKLAFTPKAEEIKLGSMALADGSMGIEFEGDALSVGSPIWVTAEDGTKVPIPVNDYPLEDGSILVVSVEGIVGEIKQADAAPDPNAPVAPVAANNDAQIADEIGNAIKSILVKYSEMEVKLESLEQANVELKAEVLKLSEQPASRPIKAVPSQVDLSTMTPLEKFRFRKSL